MTLRRATRLFLASAGGAVVLATAVLWLSTAMWDGEVPVHLHVSVSDSVTRQPVSGAVISLERYCPEFWILPASDWPEPERLYCSRSNLDGAGDFSHGFRASGKFNLLWRSGEVFFIDEALVVSSSGYEPVTLPLAKIATDSRDLYNRREISVPVVLKRAHSGDVLTTRAPAVHDAR